jgi:quercetin dioxygenase-like cupin family protein
MKRTFVYLLALFLVEFAPAQEKSSSTVQSETVLQTTNSWNGSAYKIYPPGQPQLTVLKVTIPPHTTMKWHTHPIPSVGYVLSGDITVETQSGDKKHFVTGQAIPETVNTVHRGVTGDQAAILIVFYAGAPGVALSEEP